LILGNDFIQVLLGSILDPAAGRKSGRHPQLGEDESHEHQPGCEEQEEDQGGEYGVRDGMVHLLFSRLHFVCSAIVATACRESLASAKARRRFAARGFAARASGGSRTAGKAGKLPFYLLFPAESAREGSLILTGSEKYLRDLATPLATVLINGHLLLLMTGPSKLTAV